MKAVLTIAAVLALCAILMFLFTDVIPPESRTLGSLTSARVRIEAYVAVHHRLPEKLSDVPKRAGYTHDDLDGWGKPLVYTPLADGSVVLTSLGKDGANSARSIRFSILTSGDKADSSAELMTRGTMNFLEGEIYSYVQLHHRLPGSLTEIPNLDPIFLNDSWGRPLLYSAEPDGSVILASHGKEGSNQTFSVQFGVSGVQR
jgi:hypothetical protein